MSIRKLLATLEANCPVCGKVLTRDEDGSVTCEHCTNEAREKDDYSIMGNFYQQLDIEVWILDKKKIDHFNGGQEDAD